MKNNNILRLAIKSGNISQIKAAVSEDWVKVWMPVHGDALLRRCVQTGEIMHSEDLRKRKGLISLTLNINADISGRIKENANR